MANFFRVASRTKLFFTKLHYKFYFYEKSLLHYPYLSVTHKYRHQKKSLQSTLWMSPNTPRATLWMPPNTPGQRQHGQGLQRSILGGDVGYG